MEKNEYSEEIVIVGSQYSDLAAEIKPLYKQDRTVGKSDFIRILGTDEVYLTPVPNLHDEYAVAVYSLLQKRIGYVWMYQAPAMRYWMEEHHLGYVRAHITYANPVANVLMAEIPFDIPEVGRCCRSLDDGWARNLPEVLTSIADQSLSLGLLLLRDELEAATEWTELLGMRIDNLLRSIPLDLSAYRYHEFLQVYRMMKRSGISEVRRQSDYLLHTLVYRGSEQHMKWWTEEWLPSFFREAAEGDLLGIYQAAHYTKERVEEILDEAPEHLFYLYKANHLRFANRLYYASLPQHIYNRLLTLLAVREAMAGVADGHEENADAGKGSSDPHRLPTATEMVAACEKTREEGLWWGHASWSVVFRIYVIRGFKGSERGFIDEVGKWTFKKPFPYVCDKDSVGKPLRRGKILGPLEKWASDGASAREVRLGERMMLLLGEI